MSKLKNKEKKIKTGHLGEKEKTTRNMCYLENYILTRVGMSKP